MNSFGAMNQSQNNKGGGGGSKLYELGCAGGGGMFVCAECYKFSARCIQVTEREVMTDAAAKVLGFS